MRLSGLSSALHRMFCMAHSFGARHGGAAIAPDATRLTALPVYDNLERDFYLPH